MCATICFLGCAPGSRTPSQVPTMRGGSAAEVRTGAIAKASISVNPKESWGHGARCVFTVGLLCVFRISYRNKGCRETMSGARRRQGWLCSLCLLRSLRGRARHPSPHDPLADSRVGASGVHFGSLGGLEIAAAQDAAHGYGVNKVRVGLASAVGADFCGHVNSAKIT